jgi:hypothetical protein
MFECCICTLVTLGTSEFPINSGIICIHCGNRYCNECSSKLTNNYISKCPKCDRMLSLVSIGNNMYNNCQLKKLRKNCVEIMDEKNQLVEANETFHERYHQLLNKNEKLTDHITLLRTQVALITRHNLEFSRNLTEEINEDYSSSE